MGNFRLALKSIFVATGATVPALAQFSPGLSINEPEVRRAIPVMQSETLTRTEPTPVPVMRALPVDSHVTSNPSIPSPSSMATSGSIMTPLATPVPSGIPASTMDPAGSIRLGPAVSSALGSTTDPSALLASQLALADGFYARKQAAAVPEYEKFLIMAPKNAPGRESALYRLGESQRLMQSTVAAEKSYLRVLSEYPGGQFTHSASYRLGELREAHGNYPDAANNFADAAKSTSDSAVCLAAKYHQALCLQKSGKQDEADTLFLSLVNPSRGQTNTPDTNNPSAQRSPTSAENPYRSAILLNLASNAATAGKKEQALGFYGQILADPLGLSGEILAEASLKSALLQSELGRSKEALKLFEKIAASKDAGRWRGVASLGALRLAAQAGDDDGVLKNSGAALAGESENHPEIELLRANALRRKGQNAQALEAYDSIIRNYPGSTAASQSPFQRLLTLHAMRNPSLLTEIDSYLLTASDPADRARAELLRAEETLREAKYIEAANLYHAIKSENLPPSAKTDIMYKEAWALLQGDDKAGGILALTRFLETYPDEDRAPAALAQLGVLKRDQRDFEGALDDFTMLPDRYPKAQEREMALQQKALLLGQLKRNEEMVSTFRQLLADYPKSSASPQAHYWIGLSELEKKDYAKALPELISARTGDPKEFGERAGLRILLCDYYLGNAPQASLEAAALKPALIPPEIGLWLGQKSFGAGENAKAERFLLPLVKEGLPGASDPAIQGMLATALTAQGKYREAQAPAAACLKLARDPASRARALLVSADIQRSMKNFSEASSMADEAMLLQPEGPINAESRILSGDILASRQDYAAAAKAYMTVALLNDDEALVRKSLTRAADAYQRAGNLAEATKTLEELHKRFPDAPVSASTKP